MDAAVLAAIIRDPLHATTLDVSALADADAHAIAPLLYAALRDADGLSRQPDDVRRALARSAREAALVEHVRRGDAERVLDAFAEFGIPAVVFKGAALAYTHYAQPWMRPHVDVDVWVAPANAPRAATLLESLGYRRTARPTGQHVTHQFTYVAAIGGVQVAYDIHWRIADPEVFANVLAFDEAAAESMPLPSLGARARTVSATHALAIGCMHRVAHHYDDDHLLRLVDIDRLARGLSAGEWRRFADLAIERQIRAVCRRGLHLAAEYFETPVPAGVLKALTVPDSAEPSAVYLTNRIRKVDILLSDLRALHSWRDRARLVKEHLFPPAAYIRAANRLTDHKPLTALYLWRIARGAAGWFRALK